MKALVLGAGVSGRAAIGLLDRLEVEVVVYDEAPSALGDLASAGGTVASGDWNHSLLDGVDMVVASPGFAPSSEPVVAAERSGIAVLNEAELGLRHLTSPVIAVTGTNGKTTVVELITEMLLASGLDVCAAGNIGTAISEVALDRWDVAVLELSSFQLAGIESLHPAVAVVLNLAPDHLDWHGTEAAYAAAKARIFENLADDGLLVFDADDPGACALVAGAPGRHLPVSGTRIPEGGFGVSGDWMVVADQRIALDEIQVLDGAYRVDLVAAAVAGERMGASTEAIRAVVTGFEPTRNRREVVGEWDGVTWVNDSKATNPHAALAAIAAYPSVVLIAGGRNKGLDLAPVAAATNVAHLIALGESADELLAAAHAPATRASSLAEAVEIAGRVAHRGDTVLLSPGCASFDMFETYAHRGREFATLVIESREGDT